MEKHWSLGVLVGLPVAAFFVAAGLVGLILCVRNLRREPSGYGGDRDLWWIGIGISAVLFLGFLIGGLVALYPYSAQYHQWQPKSGTVTDVSSRFIGNDKGSTQKFVVEFANDPGQRYACNDTRCSLVKEGDHLTLSCKRTWQYAGEDGWDCNYVRVGGAA